MGRIERLSAGVSVALIVAAGAASADEIRLREGAATLSAPEEISCDALPPLTLEADLGLLTGNRGTVNRLTERMGAALANACPDIDTLSVEGEDRGVSFSFEVTKAAGWKLPGAPDETPPAAAPVPPPAAAAAAQPSTPEPAALADTRPERDETAASEEPQREPAIPPGLTFNELAQFYGPVRAVRGHVALEQNETWTRILAARAYSERPSILSDDLMALEIARQMLSPAEFQQFAGPHIQTIGQGNFQQLSVFDRRDLANRVRTSLKPYLDQRRQTGPIEVYHVIPLQLGEYNFEAGGFPINVAQNRHYNAPYWNTFRVDGALNGIVMPTALQTTVDQARELDAYLRARQDSTLYLGVFMKISPKVPPSLTRNSGHRDLGTPAELTQIALFADKELTQTITDFTESLSVRQAAADRVMAELSKPLLDGETLVASLAALNESDVPKQAMITAYASQDQYGQPNALSPGEKQAQAQAALAAVEPSGTARFGGTLLLRPYDSVLGGLPVENTRLEYHGFSRIDLQLNLDAQLLPALSIIPLDAEQAAAISQAAGRYEQVEMRLIADLVQGDTTMSDGYRYTARATFAPRRVLLFSPDSSGIVADRQLLADVTLPETPNAGMIPFEALKIEN